MNRASLHRVWHAFCAGRAPREVAARLAVSCCMAAALWLCACAFLLLEPVA